MSPFPQSSLSCHYRLSYKYAYLEHQLFHSDIELNLNLFCFLALINMDFRSNCNNVNIINGPSVWRLFSFCSCQIFIWLFCLLSHFTNEIYFFVNLFSVDLLKECYFTVTVSSRHNGFWLVDKSYYTGVLYSTTMPSITLREKHKM